MLKWVNRMATTRFEDGRVLLNMSMDEARVLRIILGENDFSGTWERAERRNPKLTHPHTEREADYHVLMVFRSLKDALQN